MSEEIRDPLPAELREMERTLAGLTPARARIDRDEMMFAAGRAAGNGSRGGRQVRLWQGLCGVLVAVCAGMALFPRTQAAERTVRAPEASGARLAMAGRAPSTEGLPTYQVSKRSAPQTESSYLQLRQELLTTGLPALTGLESEGSGKGSTAGNAFVPTLRQSEGLDALPAWQRRVVFLGFGGNRI